MNSLSTMLPELSIFPLFGSGWQRQESNTSSHSANGISEEELAPE